MAKFECAFAFVLGNEGQYVNDPADPGGETYKGIARKMNPLWPGWKVIDLMKKQAGFPGSLDKNPELQSQIKLFYQVNFWSKVQGDLINNQQVANSIFDYAVNADDNVSILLAQSVVNARQDGEIGPKTIEAINGFDPGHFLAAFAVAKIHRYVEICNKRPASRKYFFGWVNRSINSVL